MNKPPRLSRFMAAWAAASFVLAVGLMTCVMIVFLFSSSPDRDVVLTVVAFATLVAVLANFLRAKPTPVGARQEHWLLKLLPWRRRKKMILYELRRKPPPPPEAPTVDEPLAPDDLTTWVPSSRPRKSKRRGRATS